MLLKMMMMMMVPCSCSFPHESSFEFTDFTSFSSSRRQSRLQHHFVRVFCSFYSFLFSFVLSPFALFSLSTLSLVRIRLSSFLGEVRRGDSKYNTIKVIKPVLHIVQSLLSLTHNIFSSSCLGENYGA